MLKHFFVALLFCATALTGRAQDISWSNDTKLTWNDFKGTPDSRSPFFAASRYRLLYAFNSHYSSENKTYTLTFKVQGVFIPNLSWVKKDRKSDALLAHEQLHFDINELYARKLLQKFQAKTYTSNFESEVKQIFMSVSQEEYDLQNRYDRESQHSINRSAQTAWKKLIYEQLSNPS
jgi:hypothetical protein